VDLSCKVLTPLTGKEKDEKFNTSGRDLLRRRLNSLLAIKKMCDSILAIKKIQLLY
jgi:hypothetical protein